MHGVGGFTASVTALFCCYGYWNEPLNWLWFELIDPGFCSFWRWLIEALAILTQLKQPSSITSHCDETEDYAFMFSTWSNDSGLKRNSRELFWHGNLILSETENKNSIMSFYFKSTVKCNKKEKHCNVQQMGIPHKIYILIWNAFRWSIRRNLSKRT